MEDSLFWADKLYLFPLCFFSQVEPWSEDTNSIFRMVIWASPVMFILFHSNLVGGDDHPLSFFSWVDVCAFFVKMIIFYI